MIIYSKFNKYRKEEFQLITTIEKNGDDYFSSKISNNKSKLFLMSFLDKFNYLKHNNFTFKLVEPQKINDKKINFCYLKGKTLDSLLFELSQKSDKENFLKLLNQFVDLIIQNKIKLETLTPQFNEVFGAGNDLKFECIPTGCIDLNFDNIIIQNIDSEFFVIDYEWTFEFPVPYKYILFRALTSFYRNYFYYNLNKKFIKLSELFDLFGITNLDKNNFINFEYNFQNYVSITNDETLKNFINNYNNLELEYLTSNFIDNKNLMILNNENLNQQIKEKNKEIQWMKSSRFWKIKIFYEKFFKRFSLFIIVLNKIFLIIKKKGLLVLINKIYNYFINNVRFFSESKISVDFFNQKTYFDFIFSQNNNKKQDFFIPYKKNNSIDSDIKAIAFYLPQYHAIPENDDWWGRGFTEWTNVSKAIPQFVGHYQPKLPGELGFYDLNMVEIQKRQALLAKNYGIFGFCYHFYWFNGKKLLEKPINNIINNLDIDFPFCINWANENWTRRWDGLENEVLIKQNHSSEDDLNFIKEVGKLFKDSRYIRIDGKPLLMVYKPMLLPDAKKTTEIWRKYCKKNGIGDIFLVTTNSFDNVLPEKIGFDACVEFAPIGFNLKEVTGKIKFVNTKYSGRVYDYSNAIEISSKYKKPEHLEFRGICPGWDNEARKPGKGTTLVNSSPFNYQKWLEMICFYTNNNFRKDEKLVFINAWNEWAEGAYLEPDRKFGYSFLESTYFTLSKFDKKINQFILENQKNFKKRHDTAVILHLYYPDLWKEIKTYLVNLNNNFDLYISLTGSVSIDILEEIKNDFPCVNFFIFENKGRDILPFLKIFKIIKNHDYKYICKIHSKKSTHRNDGDSWRQQIIGSLFESEERIASIKLLFDSNEKIGIVIPDHVLSKYKDYIGSNKKNIKNIFSQLDIIYKEDFSFPAGSMFWFRPKALDLLIEIEAEKNEFLIETGQLDGTMAHAIERIFCVVAKKNGYDSVIFYEDKKKGFSFIEK